MNLPNRGTPAAHPWIVKTAVVFGDEMVVIHHQLADDFYLLSLEGLDFVNGPVWVMRANVRRHLRDYARFLQLAKERAAGLRMIGTRLIGKGGIEPDANVIVESIRSQKLAVTSFAIRRVPTARILGEIQVSNYRMDVALA